MARYTGQALKITFGGTDVSGDFRVLEVNEGMLRTDSTAGADTHEEKIDTVKTGNANLTILAQPGSGGSALYAALAPGTGGTLIYYPEGTVPGTPAGNVKHTVTDANVIGRTHRLVYNAAVELRVDFDFDVAETVAAVA